MGPIDKTMYGDNTRRVYTVTASRWGLRKS